MKRKSSSLAKYRIRSLLARPVECTQAPLSPARRKLLIFGVCHGQSQAVLWTGASNYGPLLSAVEVPGRTVQAIAPICAAKGVELYASYGSVDAEIVPTV